jgi:soluble lytic murein transglycosylase
MQILPSVGASYASRLGLAPFEPALLYQPDLNLDFGIEHLAEALARFGGIEQALAAYNAGADRVIRWLRLAGAADDAEVFVERIPFTETRDYVRRVLRNHAMYRALYATAIP